MRNFRRSIRLGQGMRGMATSGGTRRALRRRAVAAVALVIAAALCGGLAASAWATPMWLAPVNLSEAGFAAGESPQVAVDAHGDVTAVWGRGGGGNYAV